MALRFIDGGGLYYSTMTDMWDVLAHAGSAGGGGLASIEASTNGRWGGRCIMFQRSAGATTQATVAKNLSGSLSEYVVQLAYNLSQNSAATLALVSFYEGSTLHTDIRFSSTNNAIVATRNGTQIGAGPNNSWDVSAGWRYLKIKVKISDTIGTVDVIQDGVTLMTLTGLDTRNAGTGIIDRIYLGPVTATASSLWTLRVNDFSICDTTGNAPNGIHNPGRIHCLRPTANGDTNNWTPSTGQNWQNVDETPNNGNTDYNAATAVNDIDLYALSDPSPAPTTVYGVQSNNMVARDAAGSDNAAAIIKTNSTIYVGSNVAVASATFEKVNGAWDLNPNTGVAFTPSEISALQGGVKRTA